MAEETSDIDPATIEFLSDRANKHRRAVIAISFAFVVLWASAGKVDWSKLPVVSAIDFSNESAVRLALVLLVGVLTYNAVLFAYFCYRDWKEYEAGVTSLTDRFKFPNLGMYFGKSPPRLIRLLYGKLPLCFAGEESVTWRHEVDNVTGHLILEASFGGGRGRELRVPIATAEAVRRRFMFDFLTLAVGVTSVAVAIAYASCIALLLNPPKGKLPAPEKPTVVYVGFPLLSTDFTRKAFQSFPPLSEDANK